MAFALRRFTTQHVHHSLRFASTSLRGTAPVIALCGGGIANCVAANYLASNGIETHLFEVGRGVGGRTATRRIGEYYFDHGAHVIEEPTSSEFKELLKNWQHKEWIEKWEGAFGRGRGNDDGLLMISTDENVERYVAVPAMNSLCKHLVEHELIHCHFQTRAVPSLLPRSSAGFTWKIDNTDFDWVVVSDRSIAAAMLKEHAEDADGEALASLKRGFVDPLQSVFSPVPVLAMMLTLPGRFPKSFFPFDSLCLQNHPSISLISRETSKPKRERQDSKECWVIHSTSEFAHKIMQEVASLPDDSSITFEERKQRVNERSLKVLFHEFIDVMKMVSVHSTVTNQSSPHSNITEDVVERILSGAEIIKTHRWSAAFPSVKEPLITVLNKESYVERGGGLSYVDTNLHFAACGDYLPTDQKIFGKIEGAAASGLAAAKGILQSLKR